MSTIVDVARLAGVSTATVSRVINNPDVVREETREAVQRAMKICRYQYNALARGFVTKKSNIIGLIAPSIVNAIFAEAATGVQEIASAKGYQVILGNTDYDPDKEQQLIKAFREMQVEGLIISTTNPSSPVLKNLTEEGFPFVLLFSTIRRSPISCIGVDNVDGGAMAASHLIELGHRRIGMLAGKFTISDKSKHRWIGYRNILKKNNIPYDPRLVIQLPYRLKSGKDGIKSLMSRIDPPTAVFCSNDYMAMGAIEGARELGLNLPGDLSLVGFDDNQFSSFLTPRLTTVRQPAYEMGSLGARELFNLIGEPGRKPVQKLLDIKLIERDSTARPRGL